MSKPKGISGVTLRGLSVVFGAVTHARNYLFDHGVLRSYRSRLPVVSVGNVTVGGNGKTPLCLYLVEQLQSRGMKPVILSRGYGGALKGPHRIAEGDTAYDVGDEPLLMAKTSSVPVYIARSRSAGARCIERDGAGDVIVLDDGFQHRRLRRDVDIVSLFAGSDEAARDFRDGNLLPFGRFRENRDRALKRADFAVVSYRRVYGSDAEVPPLDQGILEVLPQGLTAFRAYYRNNGVFLLNDDRPVSVGSIRAFSGIANPEGFHASLEQLGFSLAGRHSFPDHHAFSQEEVSRLVEAHPGETFVCTEKDAVKLAGMSDKIQGAFAVLKVALSVVPSDAFMVAVLRKLREREV